MKAKFDQLITVRIGLKHLKRCSKAAERRGLTMSAFCRQSMLYFADVILGDCNDAHAADHKRIKE